MLPTNVLFKFFCYCQTTVEQQSVALSQPDYCGKKTDAPNSTFRRKKINRKEDVEDESYVSCFRSYFFNQSSLLTVGKRIFGRFLFFFLMGLLIFKEIQVELYSKSFSNFRKYFSDRNRQHKPCIPLKISIETFLFSLPLSISLLTPLF